MGSVGFIILRHVNSYVTDKYWKLCYDCIRKYYPENDIVIIDDNSHPEYVSYKSIYKTKIIEAPYPKRGELLPYLYYCYNGTYYKVPTYGRIYKIIDFGRGIYKYGNKQFCSDSFKNGEDAATQYNIEPYFNSKKPRLEPNYSFDLCRLACSIFDYIIEDMDQILDFDECTPLVRLIVEWCLDDNGINILYKNNGQERYPDFKLYKMIARCVHNHTPQAQLERKEFDKYSVASVPKNENVMNVDEVPYFYEK